MSRNRLISPASRSASRKCLTKNGVSADRSSSITVRSTDIAWPLAVADMANRLRGRCLFRYGEILDFGAKISEESDMSAFFVFAPSILEKEDFLNVDVGGPQLLNIAGMYPIYDSECAVFGELGLERFWNHPNFDLYDVRRRRVGTGLSS